jgi:flagellar hook protein FlgE
MSLFGSLTTAVSGLDAQQEALSNISNNIANSQTVGYKEVDTAFQELVTQSNENFNAPGGVSARPVYLNGVAGTPLQTQVSTNIAISGTGNGFFVVKAPPTIDSSGNADFSNQDFYTRAGDFQQNSQNFLTNSAGYYLEGYPVDPTTGTVNNSTLEPIQVPQTIIQPQATANVDVTANLPSNSAAVGSSGYTSPAPATETVYDAQGNPYTLTTQYDFMGSGQTNPAGTTGLDEWQATYTISPSATGGPGSTGAPYVVDMYFNTSASSATTGQPAGTLASINGVNTTTPYYDSANAEMTTGATGADPNINSDSSSIDITSGAAQISQLSFATPGGALQFNLNYGTIGSAPSTSSTTGSLSEYSGSTVDVSAQNQDGFTTGTANGTSIDDNGFVSVTYSNGLSRKYFQIPLAQFSAPQNLSRQTGSVFSVSPDSGQPQVSAPGANGAGTISPSEVEQSNVDIASQFTQMIVTQQAYSANSKVITTADSMLTTLLQSVQ